LWWRFAEGKKFLRTVISTYRKRSGAFRSDGVGSNRSWQRRARDGDESTRLAAGFGEPVEVGLHFAICAEGAQSSFENGESAGMRGSLDPVVHPLPFPARGDDSGAAQVGEMARDLWLALAQNLDEIADADFATIHEIEQAQTSAIGQRGEEGCQIKSRGGTRHEKIIYALTYVSNSNTFV
jgi:hypothetical protein